jgi:anti-sigma B factor antagonist
VGSLTLEARRDADRAVLSLTGDLDLATVPMLREAALTALSTAGCATLVLDLAGLTFLDSTGIGCWIELRNLAVDAGQNLELAAVPPAARRTVRIAGLAPLFGLDGGP